MASAVDVSSKTATVSGQFGGFGSAPPGLDGALDGSYDDGALDGFDDGAEDDGAEDDGAEDDGAGDDGARDGAGLA